jgi:hypothetical protein
VLNQELDDRGIPLARRIMDWGSAVRILVLHDGALGSEELDDLSESSVSRIKERRLATRIAGVQGRPALEKQADDRKRSCLAPTASCRQMKGRISLGVCGLDELWVPLEQSRHGLEVSALGGF